MFGLRIHDALRAQTPKFQTSKSHKKPVGRIEPAVICGLDVWRLGFARPRAVAFLRRLRARGTRVLALPARMNRAVGDRTHALPQRNCGRFTRPSLLAGADKERSAQPARIFHTRATPFRAGVEEVPEGRVRYRASAATCAAGRHKVSKCCGLTSTASTPSTRSTKVYQPPTSVEPTYQHIRIRRYVALRSCPEPA